MQDSTETPQNPAPQRQATAEELTPRSAVVAHGAAIPTLGFGTWELDRPTARRMVETALGAGYRHIDTAQIYKNEDGVGEALRGSGVAREDLWLTTKVWPGNYAADRFAASVRASLDRLGVDSVDLLLLHWPRFEGTDLEAALERLGAAQDAGWTKHIGVSNFNTRLLARAGAASAAPLAVNQVEYHPFLDQSAVLAEVRRQRMALTAYSPIAQGKVIGNPVLREVGERHGKTEAQVALRWLIQQPGVSAIPRTSSAGHCAENLQIFDFQLDEPDAERIASLARPDGRVVDPRGLAPEWDQPPG